MIKELIKKNIIKPYNLLKVAKEIFILLNIFVFFSCYCYICICAYKFNNDNCELINICTVSFEESKLVNQSNTWYKYIIDDFFNKFTSNNKTINYKSIEVKSDIKTLMPLAPEHDISIVKKSVILNKIQSDSMKNLISEYELYKNKASLLEMELLKIKMSYLDLVKDIDAIVKEMNDSSKNS